MKRAFHIFVPGLAALLLAACTLTNIAYSNVGLAYSGAAPALAWLVGDYVDMSDEQKAFVKSRLHRAFAWHRAEELPEYERFFERVLAQAQDNITVEEAAADHRELRAYYHRAVERLLPDLADLMLQLDAEQADQMEARFNKENRKIVADASEGTPQKRGEKRVERFLTHVEQFTGRLDRAQRELVAGYVARQADLVDQRIADRRYRQAAVLALVRAKPPREQAMAELRRLLIDTDSWRNAEYQKELRARDQRLFELIAALSASLTDEQRARFQRRVRGFMHDIDDLTASSSRGRG